VSANLDRVDAIKWHHRITLPNGVTTPGADDSARKLGRLGLPDRLDGKSVLDIGAWDGYFSFECERRGARVVAYDDFVWEKTDEGFTGKRGFDLAHAAFGSRVQAVTGGIYDLAPEKVGGQFDVVLFLGVLYHLKHPMLALERVRQVLAPGGLLILETQAAHLGHRRPSLAFYPGDELSGDPTNWFAPNEAALLGLLHTTGFREAEIVWRPTFPRRLARAIKLAASSRVPLLRTIGEGRLYAHARG
jgi:tRNA (mo5U34)-methyltransferase